MNACTNIPTDTDHNKDSWNWRRVMPTMTNSRYTSVDNASCTSRNYWKNSDRTTTGEPSNRWHLDTSDWRDWEVLCELVWPDFEREPPLGQVVAMERYSYIDDECGCSSEDEWEAGTEHRRVDTDWHNRPVETARVEQVDTMAMLEEKEKVKFSRIDSIRESKEDLSMSGELIMLFLCKVDCHWSVARVKQVSIH